MHSELFQGDGSGIRCAIKEECFSSLLACWMKHNQVDLRGRAKEERITISKSLSQP
jgi:hypothetical protein